MRSPEARLVAVVEDDPIMGESLVQRLALEGYEPRWWRTASEAIDGLKTCAPDLLVCDIRLPDLNGEELFRSSLADLGAAPVLFITAFGDIGQAVRLIRAGADDYVTKPFPMDDFLDRIGHLLERRTAFASEEGPVMGVSSAMRRVESMLRRVADIDSTVLLTGESGVGKEVAARFVHRISQRAKSPFVTVNCAAIPASLIESELFGHERGAFTGAVGRHEGYAERSRDGILFLDEVSELSHDLQAKLLRLSQERAFERVGGEQTLLFRARLVCASNADLTRSVADGKFRADLYYRINVIGIEIPPLRERGDDVIALLDQFVAEFAHEFGREVRATTTLAAEAALAHDWPGNVRELRNRAERAVALAAGPWIGAADLFPDIGDGRHADREIASLAAVRDAAERRHIAKVLERTDGQVKKAAELLGVSRTTLWEKMRKLGLGNPAQP